MIEGPSGPQSTSRRPVRRFSTERLVAWLRGWVETVRRWVLPSHQHKDRSDVFLWRLQLVNRLFAVVLLGLGGYLVIDLVMLRPEPPTLITRSVPVGEPVSGQTAAVGVGRSIRPLDDYQEAMQRHDPFRLASPTATEEVGKPEPTESPIEKLISSLTVVGINRGRIPEALIEDAQTRRTYFVKVGEEVNGLTVETIDKRGVMVSYDGESTYIP